MPPEALTGGAALVMLIVREVLNFVKSRNGSAPVTVTHIQELHTKIDDVAKKVKKLKKELRYGDKQAPRQPKDRPEGVSSTPQSSNLAVA